MKHLNSILMILAYNVGQAQNVRKDIRHNWYAEINDYENFVKDNIDTLYFYSQSSSKRSMGGDKDYITWLHQRHNRFLMLVQLGEKWGLATPYVNNNVKWVVKKRRDNYILQIRNIYDNSRCYMLLPNYDNEGLNKITLVKIAKI